MGEYSPNNVFPKETVIPTVLIASGTTLQSSYRGNICGEVDLTGYSDQVIVYLEWTPGTSELGNALYGRVRFSANGRAWGIVPHENISREGDPVMTVIKEKEYVWNQTAQFEVYGEEVGNVWVSVNSARLKTHTIPITAT